VVRLASGSDRLTSAGDLVFAVGFDHPDWHNGFEHDPRRRPASGSVLWVNEAMVNEGARSLSRIDAQHLSMSFLEAPCGQKVSGRPKSATCEERTSGREAAYSISAELLTFGWSSII
jgi:hypothetical protein